MSVTAASQYASMAFSRRVVRTMTSRNGLQFRRRADGAVEVWRPALLDERLPSYVGPQVRRVAILPANEWASLISSMTVCGEDATTFAIAMAFHTGATAYDPNAAEYDADAPSSVPVFNGAKLDALEPAARPFTVGTCSCEYCTTKRADMAPMTPPETIVAQTGE